MPPPTLNYEEPANRFLGLLQSTLKPSDDCHRNDDILVFIRLVSATKGIRNAENVIDLLLDINLRHGGFLYASSTGITLTLLPIWQLRSGQMQGSTTVMALSPSLNLAIVVDEQRYLLLRDQCPPRVCIACLSRHSHHVAVTLLKKHSFHALALCAHPILLQ